MADFQKLWKIPDGLDELNKEERCVLLKKCEYFVAAVVFVVAVEGGCVVGDGAAGGGVDADV